MTRRLAVVSYHVDTPFSPRGARTRELVQAFDEHWRLTVIGREGQGPSESRGRKRHRALVRRALMFVVLFDTAEPWARRRLRAWRPEVDAAYLIGTPFSPLVYAGDALSKAGIPYIVDLGDPWVLTAENSVARGFARVRSARHERRLWERAAGAVVTTEGQASALAALFPHLKILVRPNGTDPMPVAANWAPAGRQDGTLRIGHFGSIYESRLNIAPFLDSLAASGVWPEVELHQYGPDWTGALGGVRRARIINHSRVPWHEVHERARALDLALVVGNRDRKQLPSKAVDYMTLPIPRAAVTEPAADDALTAYVSGRPGWLVVSPRAADAAIAVRDHVERRWAPDELALPDSESWASVADTIAAFVEETFGVRASSQAIPSVRVA